MVAFMIEFNSAVNDADYTQFFFLLLYLPTGLSLGHILHSTAQISALFRFFIFLFIFRADLRPLATTASAASTTQSSAFYMAHDFSIFTSDATLDGADNRKGLAHRDGTQFAPFNGKN